MTVSKWLAAGAFAWFSAVPLAASAADFPNAPVKFVVGFSPGSTIDTVARIVGEALSTRMGQSFVVENKTGANGMIAARTVAQAKPDGYTILVSNSSSITVNPLLYKDLQYDPLKDFAPVTTVVSVPFILTINAENPRVAGVSDVKSLVDLARRNPNTVSYGSAGNGNLMHLAGAQLASMSDVQMLHVPYRGAAPMEAGLMSKEVDFGFDTLSGVPLIKAGKLKALAVSTAERWHDLPDVPAVAELGYPGFDISFWVGIFAPAGTPPEVVDRLNREIAAAAKDPVVRARLAAQGNPSTQSPQAFRQKIADELKQNEALIKRANIKID
ncbi:Bug family tripartite tricarboxylate transporter substrate binding protein [Achromobacter deleyi]|uniref:Bug family tripartite tricarboxylate transporter substrate binding protein n=1 Tax=Achromobacter deleyi TaxID=1353891 RepID=UPI001490C56A|nr:tripartite tricarboxylate transporter substrate binding protein [Achromobacter deleyi]QVQ24297.1 tripartite tricarboxylate transporter substrate binding protein [Achromobacter deleyi]UIP19826.1 tripartite tricarboxylate transporter substrate binding protein [Achromobacter deleyi]